MVNAVPVEYSQNRTNLLLAINCVCWFCSKQIFV